MKKKVLSLLTIVCMTVALLSANIITAFAYTGTQYDDYLYYTISNGEATITDCNSYATSIVIPININGYPVTSIGKEAFYYCTSLTSITIPDNVTSIGYFAFYNTGYYNNASNWENDVLYIGNYLIEAKEAITSCEIKPGTKLIADDAFHGCASLTSVTIPDSVTSIGKGAFYECGSLISINVEKNNKNYCSLNGVLFNKDKTCLVRYPEAKEQNEYVIPDGVTNIDDYAFYRCTNLKKVIIPVTVTSIGGMAFNNDKGWDDQISVYYEGSEEDWKKIDIAGLNYVLDDAEKIYNVTKKTYKFETNCENKLSDITDYMVMTAPEIKNGSKTFLGWYDNKSFTGNPVSFPYYGEATTLYALWGGTDTVCVSASGYKIFISIPSNIPENASVILACYKDDMLVDVQTEPNKNSTLYFVVKEDFDSAKVMVWDSLSGMNSDYEAEKVK